MAREFFIHCQCATGNAIATVICIYVGGCVFVSIQYVWPHAIEYDSKQINQHQQKHTRYTQMLWNQVPEQFGYDDTTHPKADEIIFQFHRWKSFFRYVDASVVSSDGNEIKPVWCKWDRHSTTTKNHIHICRFSVRNVFMLIVQCLCKIKMWLDNFRSNVPTASAMIMEKLKLILCASE